MRECRPVTEPTETPARSLLIWATGIGVVGLAVGGFVLSFSALNDLAVASGVDRRLSFLWPLIVDGFIVVATAAAFALKRQGRAVTWYPWTALILFSTISVVGNSIHAMQAPRLAVPVPIAAMVSSIPAIALLVATHLLVVILDRNSPRRQSQPDAQAAPAPTVRDGQRMATRASAEPALTAQLREYRSRGTTITGSLIAQLEGVSERTGRRRLEGLRVSVPDLFETEDI